MSEELINKIQKLIELKKGDPGRLEHILNSIKQGKSLFSSDQRYLDNLIETHLSKESKVEVLLSSKEKKIETNQPEENLDKVQELQKMVKDLKEKVVKSDLKDSWKQQNYKSKEKSILENKTLLVVIILVSLLIISLIISVKFGDPLGFTAPPGVGPVESDHAHAAFTIMLNGAYVDTSTLRHPEYAFGNKYIFYAPQAKDFEEDHIHRVATGATIGLFLESMGFKLTDECLILPEGATKLDGAEFERKEWCNEGDYKIKLYAEGSLFEGGQRYVIRGYDSLFLVYDDNNEKDRGYKTYLPRLIGAPGA